MTVTAIDTTVVVAGLLDWHEHHRRAGPALAEELASDDRIVIPFTVVAQAFSVMTRFPHVENRVPPHAARAMLRHVFATRAVVLAAPGDAVWSLLDEAIPAGVSGAGIHDFEILRTSAEAGAKRLLTLNARDFRRFGPRGVEIVEP